jgi:hypothetical protein
LSWGSESDRASEGGRVAKEQVEQCMAEPEPEAEVQPSNDGPLYIVKKWKVVGTWSWNFESGPSPRCALSRLPRQRP